MHNSTVTKPICINKPMVIIPTAEYKLLLREAGLDPTPKLDREITLARRNYKKNKTISWKSVKNGVK